MRRTARPRRAGTTVLIGLTVVVLWPGPVLAHSELESATPADGTTVRSAPDRITLVFGESVRPRFSQVAVTGPNGGIASTRQPVVSGARIDQPVTVVAAGSYTVAYRRVCPRDPVPTGT